MSWQASGFLRAARSHESAGLACQDAQLSAGGPNGFAALSDGCSSGIDSGAISALLIRAAHHHRSPSISLGEIARLGWQSVADSSRGVGLVASESPATLLLARGQIRSRTHARLELGLWGDGFVALSSEDGELAALWTGSSAQNMPAYPAYAFDDALWSAFELQGGRSDWALSFEEPSASLAWRGDPPRWDSAFRGWFLDLEIPVGWTLTLLSDGASSISGLDALSAARALCSGKGPGDFARRRARKAVDTWHSQGMSLGDDLGLCALRPDVFDSEASYEQIASL